MILSKRTLEKLRELINVETEYRSGPQIVQFFNELGFNDTYSKGFPSRWVYTDDKLAKINGTPELDKCIKNVLAPVNFVDRIDDLDKHIADFNKYLVFDKWKVVREDADICFKKLDKIKIDSTSSKHSESEFLSREFTDVNVRNLGLEDAITDVLQHRIEEIERCFKSESSLAVILLAGSTLEGILLGLATQYPRYFNSAKSSPKHHDGKVKRFYEWKLIELIEVIKELKLIQHDTYKFSHTLRDFRNYIHPFEQLSTGFRPRVQTAKICLQVLRAAISEMNDNIDKIRT